MTHITIPDLPVQLENEVESPKKRPLRAPPERVAEFDEKVKNVENKYETEEDKIVEELNKKHAIVHIDQFYILTEKAHEDYPDSTDFTLETRQSFLNTYENQKIPILLSDGSRTLKSKAKIWLEHDKRRQYLNGITFDPTHVGHKDGFYNIWKGFAVQPIKGCCELFKAHIKDVICSGNSEYYGYIWKWLAYLIQKPNELSTGIVLMSNQGTGKGEFVRAIGKLLGPHFVHLSSLDELLGKFNTHMKHAVLVYADEAIWGGNKKEIGKFKAMITESHVNIEPKGKDIIRLKNFRHFILSSNEDWPVQIDHDCRRLLVLKVSAKHKEDIPYFRTIREELKNGGYEALLYDLLNEDISNFEPRMLPRNIEAFEVKKMSMSSVEQYIYEALCEGHFDIGNDANFANFDIWKWKDTITVDSIYNDYCCWCVKQNISNERKDALGRALHKIIPSIQKKKAREGEHRPSQYNFPELAKARKDFESAFKADFRIWE